MGYFAFVSIVTIVYDQYLISCLKYSFVSEPCFVCVVLQLIVTVAVATAEEEEEVCVLIMPDCIRYEVLYAYFLVIT